MQVKDGEYGIQETLDGMNFIIPLANAIDETSSDGFKWTEIIEFVPALSKLPAAIAGGADIPKELGDLSDMERQQLIEKAKEMEFADEHAEEIAEKSINALVALGELAAVIKKSKR